MARERVASERLRRHMIAAQQTQLSKRALHPGRVSRVIGCLEHADRRGEPALGRNESPGALEQPGQVPDPESHGAPVGHLAVPPFSQAPVNLIQLAVDAGLDLVQFLSDVVVGRPAEFAGDPADHAVVLNLFAE